MPPRTSLTTSFSITDANNEVVCPLSNQDGSSCRKRCTGEKRYRSMQEHIRRAHPQHYISKLPATEESFLLMINTPPSQVQSSTDSNSTSATHGFRERQTDYRHNSSGPVTPRNSDEYSTGSRHHLLGAVTAAAVLAELHGVGSERDVDVDGGYHSDLDGRRVPKASIELPPLHHISNHDVTSDPYSTRQRETLPSILSGSPPGRSSTLPPLHRPLGPMRSRKHSISKRSKDGHNKKDSRGSGDDWLRRIQNDDDSGFGSRKAASVEPEQIGKRWKDLIDAAGQARAHDRINDGTPMPRSPVSIQRSSMPPFSQQTRQQSNYQASPLQQALTPPSHNQDHVDPFSSVESGDNFRMATNGLSDSSPTYTSQNVQIYCAACQGVTPLKSSYACTECICGLCSTCVEVLMAEHGARRKCPYCATIGGRFKPFQLQIR